MIPRTTVVLLGPMGAGKTTIGRLLAQRLNLPFFDSDKEIEQRCGASIPWIFDIEGEAGFRERETEALQTLLANPACVLATGGGIVKMARNRDLLKQAKVPCVYLRTSVATQLARTAQDKNRPLLQQDDPELVLTQLLAEREPFYQDLSAIQVHTDLINPVEIVAQIMTQLESL